MIFILLIGAGVLFLLCYTIIIFKETKKSLLFVFLSIPIFVLMCVLVLIDGTLSKKEKETLLEDKARIISCLERKDEYFNYYIKEAKLHNMNVNENNNYFYRFNIEDRSEYKIDIEYYKSTLIMEE